MLIGTWRDRAVARNGTLGFRFGNPATGSADFQLQTLPDEVFGRDHYASIVPYAPRVFLLGQFSVPLVITEDLKVHVAGIPAPAAPTLEKGSGTLAGKWRVALKFAHVIGRRTVAESALSTPSEEVDMGAPGSSGEGSGGLHITNIPTLCVNPRVNRVRAFASFEGGAFRRIWERPLGVTTVDDATRVLASGEAADDFDATTPPIGALYGCVYRKRMIYAGGDLRRPYRAYYSAIGRPEQIDGFWDTEDRDPIVGVASHNEVCWLLTPTAINHVRGYNQDDFVVRKVSDIGCVSHHSIISLRNWLLWLADDGCWGYQEGFRYLMEGVRDLWHEQFRANPSGHALAYAENNRPWNVVEFAIPGSRKWVGDYEGFIAGRSSEPDWTQDEKARTDRVACCTRSGYMLVGGDDSWIRVEDETDGTDDGDTFGKALRYMTGPQHFGDVGGDRDSGKRLMDVRFLCESEQTEWEARIIGGDESAHDQYAETVWSKTIPASYATKTVAQEGVYEYVAKTVHHLGTPSRSLASPGSPASAEGRMFFFEVQVASPVQFKFRGVEGFWAPGGNASRLLGPLNEGTDIPPVMTTTSQASITSTTATLGGTVTFVGNPVGDMHGVCYAETATNPDPEVDGPGVTTVDEAATVSAGSFTISVTGLTPGTAYSFKAFAENAFGSGYTVVGTFETAP